MKWVEISIAGVAGIIWAYWAIKILWMGSLHQAEGGRPLRILGVGIGEVGAK